MKSGFLDENPGNSKIFDFFLFSFQIGENFWGRKENNVGSPAWNSIILPTPNGHCTIATAVKSHCFLRLLRWLQSIEPRRGGGVATAIPPKRKLSAKCHYTSNHYVKAKKLGPNWWCFPPILKSLVGCCKLEMWCLQKGKDFLDWSWKCTCQSAVHSKLFDW